MGSVLVCLAWLTCLSVWQASKGGMDGHVCMGGMLWWVAWVGCLRGWHASVVGVLVWMACQCGLCGWCAIMSKMGDVPAWVAY